MSNNNSNNGWGFFNDWNFFHHDDDHDHGHHHGRKINGTFRNDTLIGTAGDDHIRGKGGDDQLIGLGGNDDLEGDRGNDLLDGGDGRDELRGNGGRDTLLGGAGKDELDGGDGNDLLDGGDGSDELDGDDGNDVLIAGAGNDKLDGGDDNDRLEGGGGYDGIDGGRGFDTAVYSGAFSDYELRLIGHHHGHWSHHHFHLHGVIVNDLRGGKPDGVDWVEDVEALEFSDFTLYLDGRNNAPYAVADLASTDEDTALLISGAVLAANDVDFEGDDLTVTAVSQVSGGGAVALAGGDVSFDPGAAYQYLAVGESATAVLEYTVSDEDGASDTALITVTVSGVNDGPVANADSATTDEENPVSVDVLANDTDPDTSDTLTLDSAAIVAGLGSVSIVGGEIEYDPGMAYQSLAVGDSATVEIVYTISDNHSAPGDSTATVTVTGVNDGPDALNDELGEVLPAGFTFNPENGHFYRWVQSSESWFQASASAQAMGGYLATVTSAEENAFVYSQILDGGSWTWLGASDAAAEGEWYWVEGPEAGQQFWLGDPSGAPVGGMYSNWEPGSEPNNSGDIEDHGHMWGGGGWNDLDGNGAIYYMVEIGGRPGDPTGAGPFATEDAAVTASTSLLLANDTDVDAGTVLTVTAVSTVTAGVLVSLSLDGTEFTYDGSAVAAFQSLAAGEFTTDTFTYFISDGDGGSDSAEVTVVVAGVNDGPVAVDDSASTLEDVQVSGSVLGNDTDDDLSDILTTISTSFATAHGSVTINGSGGFTYTPGLHFSGSDSFDYTVTDGHGGFDTGTVDIAIAAVADAPTLGVPGTDALYAGFESGFGPWTTLGNVTTVLNHILASDDPGDGQAGTNALPTEGVRMARLESTPQSDAAAQTFLNLPAGSLDALNGPGNPNNATIGSAMKTTLALSAGQVFSLDWRFATPEGGTFFNDFGFVSVGIAPANSAATELADLIAVGSQGNSGWQTFTYTASATGTYTFGLGVFNSQDSAVNSFLLVDDVRVSSAGTSGDEDTAISIPIGAALVDMDGSESLSIAISGVGGATLSAGTDLGGGNWILTPAQLAGLTVTPELHSDADLTLTVTATSTEAANGDTASTTASFDVEVEAVADAPIVTGASFDALFDGFESGLGLWQATGIVGTAASHTYAQGGGSTAPTEGALMARLQSQNQSDMTVEAFLGVPAGSLDALNTGGDPTFNNATVGAGMKTTLALNAGEEFSWDWLFATTDYNPFKDFGFLSVNGSVTLLSNIPAVGDYGNSGWQNFTYTASTSGSYTFGLGVFNTGDGGVDSFLMVDNVHHSADGAAGDEDSAIALNGISAQLVDTDGSESITGIVVSGVPAGASLNHGISTGGGTWSLTLADLAGLTITPPLNDHADIALTVTATSTETSNGDAASSSTTFTVVVNPVNDAPAAANDSFGALEDIALVGDVLANDEDVDLDALTAVLETGPAHGTLALNADGSFTYTPEANYHGPDSFTYHASDGSAPSNTATVSIGVAPVNDAPAIVTEDLEGAVTEAAGGGGGSGPAKVAVVYSSAQAGGQSVVDRLNDDTHFDFTATLVHIDQVDTLAELGEFDVVIDAQSYFEAGSEQYYAALRDWVTAGEGGVITTDWFAFKMSGNTLSPSMRANADFVTPISGANSSWGFSPASVYTVDSSHAITAGMTSLADPAQTYQWSGALALDAGSVSLAAFTGNSNGFDGTHSGIAYTDMAGVGRQVWLGGFYSDDGYRDNAGSAVADQLLEQATNWVAGGGSSSGPLTDSGVITFSDVDLADVHLVSPNGAPVGASLGALTAVLDADTTGTGVGGQLTWNYTVDAAAVEFLDAGETHVDSFTITLDDQNGGVISRQIDVTITGAGVPVNNAPVAEFDKVVIVPATAGATSMNIHAPTDVDGDALTATVSATPTNGTVRDAADNIVGVGAVLTVAQLTGLTFTPNAGAGGTTSGFEYSVSDGNGGSDTAAAAVSVYSGDSAADAELIANGGFETGTFSDWTVSQMGGGTYYIDSVSPTPTSGFPHAGPAAGSFLAISDQSSPTVAAVEQSFTVPDGAVTVTLEFDMFVNNWDGPAVVGPLDFAGTRQYARVDLLSEGSGAFDLGVGVVIRNFYAGVDNVGGSPLAGWTHYTFDITSNVTAGGTYDLRFAEADTLAVLNHGIDNVSIEATFAAGATAQDLVGTAGNDVLVGGGSNDTLTGNAGNDLLVGDAGSDRFDYNAIGDGIDTIGGFAAGAGGDALDLRDVLAGYNPATPDDFIQLVEADGNTTVWVNSDGAGADFYALATLEGQTGLVLNNLLADGNLIVA